MPRPLPPALAYLTAVFAIAFALGVVRTLWLTSAFGEVTAVTGEVAVILTLSWVIAGRVLHRWPLPRRTQRAAMGAFAFAGLMLLELALGHYAFGRPLATMLTQMTTPAGLIGLAGQLGFGLIPWLRSHPRG